MKDQSERDRSECVAMSSDAILLANFHFQFHFRLPPPNAFLYCMADLPFNKTNKKQQQPNTHAHTFNNVGSLEDKAEIKWKGNLPVEQVNIGFNVRFSSHLISLLKLSLRQLEISQISQVEKYLQWHPLVHNCLNLFRLFPIQYFLFNFCFVSSFFSKKRKELVSVRQFKKRSFKNGPID